MLYYIWIRFYEFKRIIAQISVIFIYELNIYSQVAEDTPVASTDSYSIKFAKQFLSKFSPK